ncbi:competence/damage-inducible protein cinA [Frankia casuarinae]|uniref:CinA-like protein n=2 Tax=Frankia casuarinae (strain DSM 45818 / CECT 9043 / HFP020203 / CcI3) TaxID=106370 RepID=CINAL_FRACC|nr:MULTISPECIES: competence/damage-inducible protein A [Frankia]Q2J752.1 RecName: Full=CinA-like protein [Frankia casuarinae]ABD12890.1 competence/damage-inducible protein cinA [Frankia casuarinae]ETA03489.1 competence/damage-inducible protein cinA [Frankia sp. CcI6]EYT89936.1 competence/damage-inducible protein cinA [Frankia casuarinae]KDA43676.1 competence/damage-inducible protein cinA [Frankia sp. BMG5.23]KEZ35641.1 competence/damage-inducible protein cinA [Frankia sp. CeD]
MRAELLAVGDELLYGDIVNGNAAWLGRQLADVGVTVTTSTVVGDDIDMIATAIRVALDRADVVIMTGGLGPTQDDLTREGIAAAAGVGLRRDDFLESMLRRRFRDMGRGDGGRRVPQMNYRQADLPEGAQPLPNGTGTAPGIRMEIGTGVVYAMPGVPFEMNGMFTASVLPDILRRAGQPAVVVHRVLRTAGMWESAVAEALADEVDRLARIGNPRIAFLASGGQTRVRITARARDRAEAEMLIAPVETAARTALGAGVYGGADDSLEGVVLGLLVQRSATLAVAESITGGLLAGRLTDVPGASAAFRGGIVSYATEVKASALGVDEGLLAAEGAVSSRTAAAMAAGVRSRLGATYGLATTGVAGPQPQEDKPVGTLHIGLAGPDGTVTRSVRLPGDRPRIRTYAVVSALDLVRRMLAGLPNSEMTTTGDGAP